MTVSDGNLDVETTQRLANTTGEARADCVLEGACEEERNVCVWI